MNDLNSSDGISEPQSCYKCNDLPEDILMLACNHDLCLECAAKRLSLESKRRPATGIVCEFCGQKTQLDAESIVELERIALNTEPKPKKDIRQSNLRVRGITEEEDFKRTNKYSEKYQRTSRNQMRDEAYQKYEKNIAFKKLDEPHASYKQSSSSLSSNVKRNCSEHPEEEILYYCFQCNCECICPECVIHGQHKDHHVKTIKKSQPEIKAKLEHFLQNIDINIDGLISKKTEFDNKVKDLIQKNNFNKKQIQKSFADLRNKLNSKQKQILAKCNKVLESTIDNYERGIKTVLKKIQDIKSSSYTIADHLKKQDLVMLNFYSKKHMDFQQLVDKIDTASLIDSVSDKLLTHDIVTKPIEEIADKMERIDIDDSVRYDAKYEDKERETGVRKGSDVDEADYLPARVAARERYVMPEEKPAREYLRRY